MPSFQNRCHLDGKLVSLLLIVRTPFVKCVTYNSSATVGELLGAFYAKAAFSGDSLQDAEIMIQAIEVTVISFFFVGVLTVYHLQNRRQ